MNASPHTDPRAVWLRSLGWRESAEGAWTGPVAATEGGRYKPMSLDHAYQVALKRSVIDDVFRVEIAVGEVRLVSPWRMRAPDDRD